MRLPDYSCLLQSAFRMTTQVIFFQKYKAKPSGSCLKSSMLSHCSTGKVQECLLWPTGVCNVWWFLYSFASSCPPHLTIYCTHTELILIIPQCSLPCCLWASAWTIPLSKTIFPVFVNWWGSTSSSSFEFKCLFKCPTNAGQLLYAQIMEKWSWCQLTLNSSICPALTAVLWHLEAMGDLEFRGKCDSSFLTLYSHGIADATWEYCLWR